MRLPFVILIFSIGLIGCSSSYIVSNSPNGDLVSFSKFNAAANNEYAKIVFQDNSTVDVHGVWATPDSTSWINLIVAKKEIMPTPKIKKIILTGKTRGALEGAGIGILSGGAIGLLSAVGITRSTNGRDPYVFIVMPILGGLIGLITGPIAGSVIGHTYEYEFVNESDDRLKRSFERTPFFINLKPQKGYGINLGFNKIGGTEGFELGIVQASLLDGTENSFLEKYFSIEYNLEGPAGFIGGAHVKGFADGGLAMNYMTSFTGFQGLYIRPQLGFSLIPGGNLHATIQYDLPLWKKTGYRNVTHLMFGLRYTLGIVQMNKTE